MHIYPTKYKIFLGKGALPPCNPPNRVYVYIWQKRGWKCAFMVPKNTDSTLFGHGGRTSTLGCSSLAALLWPPEIIYFCLDKNGLFIMHI